MSRRSAGAQWRYLGWTWDSRNFSGPLHAWVRGCVRGCVGAVRGGNLLCARHPHAIAHVPSPLLPRQEECSGGQCEGLRQDTVVTPLFKFRGTKLGTTSQGCCDLCAACRTVSGGGETLF